MLCVTRVSHFSVLVCNSVTRNLPFLFQYSDYQCFMPILNHESYMKHVRSIQLGHCSQLGEARRVKMVTASNRDRSFDVVLNADSVSFTKANGESKIKTKKKIPYCLCPDAFFGISLEFSRNIANTTQSMNGDKRFE